jgi:WD40 repeat protein
VFSLAILPNGYIVSGSGDKNIMIWNPNQTNPEMTLSGHTYSVWSLAILKNGYIVSGSADKNIMIWNPNHTNPVRKLTKII